ncbi:MAG: hypothetical protein ACAI44_33090, partial [Candidatus Sericytochromatia bacterium]
MEALKIFEALLASKGVRLPPGVLEESMALSACMLQAIVTEAPFELKLHSNLWQVYEAALVDQSLALAPWQGIAYRDWKGPPYHSLKLREKVGSRQ